MVLIIYGAVFSFNRNVLYFSVDKIDNLSQQWKFFYQLNK